ncbi:MAG: hypothetical protein HYY76_00825 [Acidobacteria bacterium]|nr:hypothetical protein [Acidobacteriota bacterium]
MRTASRAWPAAVLWAAACAAGCGAAAFEQVTKTPASAHEPSLATFADGMAVAWYDTRHGHGEIYLRALDTDGRPVGPERRLTAGAADAYEADIQPLVDGVVVGWYEKSADGRLTPKLGAWTREGRQRWVVRPSARGRNTVVRTHGDLVFAAWIEDEPNGRATVWAGWWRADGRPVAPAGPIAPAGKTTWNLNAALEAAAGADRPRAWVVFDAGAATRAEELFLARIGDLGAEVVRLTADDGFASKYPDVALADGRVALTWFDRRDGNEEVYLFVGNALEPGLDRHARRVTATPGESIGAYLAWNGRRLGLAWCDDTGGGAHEVYFVGPLYGSTWEFCTRHDKPYSGPRRAKRAKQILANQPRACIFSLTSTGYQGRSPWLVAYDRSGRPEAAPRRMTHTAADSLIPAIRPWRSGFALAWNEYRAPRVEGHGAGGRGQIAVAVLP